MDSFLCSVLQVFRLENVVGGLDEPSEHPGITGETFASKSHGRYTSFRSSASFDTRCLDRAGCWHSDLFLCQFAGNVCDHTSALCWRLVSQRSRTLNDEPDTFALAGRHFA